MRPSIVTAVLAIFCFTSSASAQMTTAQMQNAIDRHMCPASAQEENELDYSSCAALPSGNGHLDCQNHIDAENRRISAYNNFIRDCRAADTRRANSPSNQTNSPSPAQLELARAKEAAKNKAEGSDAANTAAQQQLPGLTREKAAADQAAQAVAAQRQIDTANATRRRQMQKDPECPYRLDRSIPGCENMLTECTATAGAYCWR
jgi:hypothetical protein